MAAQANDDISPVQEKEREQHLERAKRSKAVEFLISHATEETTFTYEEEKAVLRRIDKRILILILWAYFFQQLDKSSMR